MSAEKISTKNEAPENILKEIPKLGQLTDRFGNTFHFGNAGDFWMQAFPIGADNDFRTHAKEIKNMAIRDDDVLICSFPKTGLHWHMEIVRLLIDKTAELGDQLDEVRCFIDSRAIHTFSSAKSPRLLVTHVPFRHIPKQALEKKIKIICLDRNSKDVLVSYYNHMHKHVVPLNYPGTFEHFFYLSLEVGYLYGDMFDYMMEWQKGREDNPDINFYISVYEDMKHDAVGGVKKLNAYLSTGCSDELCEQIAKACCFEGVKKWREEKAPELIKSLFIGNENGIYRKGDVGDWKNWFTPAMNAEFDREYNKRMAGYKNLYKYSL